MSDSELRDLERRLSDGGARGVLEYARALEHASRRDEADREKAPLQG